MSTAIQFPALRDASPLPAERVEPAAVRQVPVETIEADSVFTREQIRQFRADDGAAIGTIAKIMTTLFTYTVIIMTGVLLWTISAVA